MSKRAVRKLRHRSDFTVLTHKEKSIAGQKEDDAFEEHEHTEHCEHKHEEFSGPSATSIAGEMPMHTHRKPE